MLQSSLAGIVKRCNTEDNTNFADVTGVSQKALLIIVTGVSQNALLIIAEGRRLAPQGRSQTLAYRLESDVQTPWEHATMQEVALSCVYTLTSLAMTSHSPLPSAISPVVESEIRARVFWYAYVQESISIAVRGGRLVFDQDNPKAFRATLSSSSASALVSSITPPLPSPISPTFPDQKNTNHCTIQFLHNQRTKHLLISTDTTLDVMTVLTPY